MPRIFPILFCLLLVTLTIRIGDLMVEAVTGAQSDRYLSEAQAADDKKDEKADKEEAVADDKADADPAEAKTVIKDSTTDKVLTDKDAVDPFAPQFSDEELNVLQSLSQRREQLDQRDRDLDQREKLLQAAEKKVEQKFTELNGVKTEMEKLLGQQQEAESESTKQLVRIYETMKPKDAANIFNDMEGDILLKIISAMSERKSAPVLAAMDPAKARDISSQIAAQKALPAKAAANP